MEKEEEKKKEKNQIINIDENAEMKVEDNKKYSSINK
jgi:hypothetical protein